MIDTLHGTDKGRKGPSAGHPAAPFRLALLSMPWAIFNRPSIQLGTLKAYVEGRREWLKADTFHPYLEIAATLGSETYQRISLDIWIGEALYAPLLFPAQTAACDALIDRLSCGEGRDRLDAPAIRQILADRLERLVEGPAWGQYRLAGFSVCFSQLMASLVAAHRLKERYPHLAVVLGGSSCCGAAGAALLRNFPRVDYVVSGEGEGALAGLCDFLAGQNDTLPGGLFHRGAEPIRAAGPVVTIQRHPVSGGDNRNRNRNMLRKASKADPDPDLDLDFDFDPDSIKSKQTGSKFQPDERIRSAGDPGTDEGAMAMEIASLDDLPLPDYRDYFLEIGRHFGATGFIPALPVEFSRGCWWGRCSFCNLNLQWRGYRAKSAGRMAAEVKTLAERHGCLDFSFTDNALRPGESRRFFQDMAHAGLDCRFFAEIRAIGKAEEQARLFADYRRGGMTCMQVGIEALSDSLLGRMQKGVSVMDNVAAMREALANRMVLEGNLIVEFPGSTDAEVEETLEVLEFLLPFHPLTIAAFFLGYDSPVDRQPESFGIRARVHHPHAKALFPAPLLRDLTMLVMDYRGDRREQRRRWRPVRERVGQWRKFHQSRKPGIMTLPPLSFRDGGTFLIIRQERPDQPVLHHRVRGPSRQLYLFCGQVRTMAEIVEQFPDFREEALRDFLRDMAGKRLIFSDGNRYLSLAVRAGTYGKGSA